MDRGSREREAMPEAKGRRRRRLVGGDRPPRARDRNRGGPRSSPPRLAAGPQSSPQRSRGAASARHPSRRRQCRSRWAPWGRSTPRPPPPVCYRSPTRPSTAVATCRLAAADGSRKLHQCRMERDTTRMPVEGGMGTAAQRRNAARAVGGT